MFDHDGDLRQRTKSTALRIAKFVSTLPEKDRVCRIWGDQLLRSGSSIGANYREAQRARSKAEYASKVGDSLREAEESLYWIELFEDNGTVKPALTANLKNEINQLIAIFITLINKRKTP